MSTYRFRYLRGQSAPYEGIQAQNDAEFFEKLAAFESDTGCRHIRGYITRNTAGKLGKVEEPLPLPADTPRSLVTAGLAHEALQSGMLAQHVGCEDRR